MAKIEMGSYVKVDGREVADFDEGPVMYVSSVDEKRKVWRRMSVSGIAYCEFWSSVKQEWITNTFPLSTLRVVSAPKAKGGSQANE